MEVSYECVHYRSLDSRYDLELRISSTMPKIPFFDQVQVDSDPGVESSSSTDETSIVPA